MNELIPVQIITGFLGAGKTTLLNHILSNPQGKKYAVIVNEFGEIGIDSNLVIGVDEEIFELNNGCVCCNVRGDLIRILGALFKRSGSFDAILVETTGLANPAPVAQTFFADDEISRKSRLEAIITVVDAKHILQSLQEFKEAVHQIAFADVVILNKIASVNAEELKAAKLAIQSINKGVKIIEANNSIINFDEISSKNNFGFGKNEQGMSDSLSAYFEAQNSQPHHHHHNHYDGVETLSLSTEHQLDAQRFTNYLSMIIDAYGENLLRFKGVVSLHDDERPYIVNGVHMMVDADYFGTWKAGEQKLSRLVFIGKNLPKADLEKNWETCFVSQ